MERKITETCIVLIVAFFALILPQLFVPIMAGMLLVEIHKEVKQ